MHLRWHLIHDKWISLYRDGVVVGHVAGQLTEFNCHWRVIKRGGVSKTRFASSGRAASALLAEAKGGAQVEMW